MPQPGQNVAVLGMWLPFHGVYLQSPWDVLEKMSDAKKAAFAADFSFSMHDSGCLGSICSCASAGPKQGHNKEPPDTTLTSQIDL